MLYSEILKGLTKKPQYSQGSTGGVGGGVGGFNLFTAIKNLFTPKPAAAPKQTQTQTKSTQPFVPQISTQQGTKTYTSGPTYSSNFQSKAPTPQYSTPSNAVGMSTNQGPVYNTGSGSYSVSSGQPVDLQRIAYSAPTIQKSIIKNPISGFVNNLKNNLSNSLTQISAPANSAQRLGTQAYGSLGKLITNVGTALKAPQLISGGLGANMQSAAGYALKTLIPAKSVYGDEQTPNVINESSNKINYGNQMSRVPSTINRGSIDNPTNPADLETKNTQIGADVTKNQTELDNYLALISDEAIKASDEKIYQEAVANGWSQDEYNTKAAEEQKRILSENYAKLKAEAEGQIPYLQTQTDQEIADEAASLAKTEKAAEAKKAETNMTYDELLKKSVSTQRDEENRLRNIFSNLGTSESSAFINKLGSLVGERGAERSKIDLTRAKDLTSIADFITEQQTTSGKNTKAYKDQLAENIRQIRSYITNDLGSQEAQGISNITQGLYNKLAEGKQNLFNVKAGLLQGQANRASALQDKLGTYALEKDLIKSNADATLGLTGNAPGMIQGYTRPSGFESNLWNTVETLKKQGVNKDSILSQIAGTYRDPKYAWMLEYLGKILA